MIRTVVPIDVVACRLAGVAAAHILPRRPEEHWLVASGPVEPDQPVPWVAVTQENYVHVPLVRYVTVPDPAGAVAFAASIGALVGLSMDLPRDAVRLHLAYGSIVEQAGPPQAEPAYGIYLGFALQLR